MKSAVRNAALVALAALLASEKVILAQPTNGSIVAWGRNDYGECDVPSPNTGFTAVAAGLRHCLGLKSDGSIVAWGDNGSGQCNVPPPNTDFAAVAVGVGLSLGLKVDGSIVAWGDNHDGQCDVPLPNTDFTAVAAWDYCIGLKSVGSIVAWGLRSETPSPNTGFVKISAGGNFNLGLKTDGSVVAWGNNDHGQCNVPSPNADFAAMSACAYHSLGLKSDGSIVAWGRNTSGQCDVPSPNTGFVAVAAGLYHSLGMKSNGAIVGWGYNDYDQCDVPSPNIGFLAVSGGGWYSLGLMETLFALTVTDVPNDQGGQLTMSWPRLSLDAVEALTPITTYEVQRFSTDWQTVAAVFAVLADSYSVDVATPDTLTIGQAAPYSRYRVVAMTSDPLRFYESLPDSGYSLDNIPPPAPSLNLYDSETSRVLIWQNPTVPDFEETCLYRGESPDFTPGDPLQCGTGIVYQEQHLIWYAYKARSFDIHGNPSDWSNEVVGRYPTGVPVTPAALRLYPNQPNPFNPMTTIRFDVPVAGSVRLSVYDVAGRLIRTLVDSDVPPGTHEAVWDGRDAAGRATASGSYVARLEAGGKLQTVRMSLVR